jgi:hypothetical protein
VNVVFGAADREGSDFVIPAISARVCPQSRLPFLRDGVAAVLGAEDQMDVNSGEGMRHCAAPSGLSMPYSASSHRFRGGLPSFVPPGLLPDQQDSCARVCVVSLIVSGLSLDR